jgi:hypothetical protein
MPTRLACTHNAMIDGKTELAARHDHHRCPAYSSALGINNFTISPVQPVCVMRPRGGRACIDGSFFNDQRLGAQRERWGTRCSSAS